MREGYGPVTGSAGVAANAAAVQRWRNMSSLGTGRRTAAGWVESCDDGMTAGSGRGSGCVGGGVAAVAADVGVAAAVAAGGAAASAGAAAGAGAGSSVMR